MPVYGAFEAKNKLSELLDRALRGEEVVISRRGKPEVKIVPVGHNQDEDERKAMAVDRLRALRTALRKRGASLSVEEILAARDEGRG